MWIWQHPDWPNFVFDPAAFPERVEAFHRAAERLSGRVEALSNAYQTDAHIALMLSEVIATSAIEGERLDRDSVRSSLLRHFGEIVGAQHDDDRAAGATELILDVRRNWHRPLSHDRLGHWQSLIVVDRLTSTIQRGAYRNNPEPMRIVSGRHVGRPRTVHYEAPPAAQVPAEMERFLGWYNGDSGELAGPVRAAVAHVWFEKAFVLDKTRFHDRYGDRLNERQRKVIARVFAQGRTGLAGGLSARNYVSIARCSPATATRDLAALRDMGALVSSGRGRALRYEVSCPGPPSGWSQSATNSTAGVQGSG